jgi:hypothetical protein
VLFSVTVAHEQQDRTVCVRPYHPRLEAIKPGLVALPFDLSSSSVRRRSSCVNSSTLAIAVSWQVSVGKAGARRAVRVRRVDTGQSPTALALRGAAGGQGPTASHTRGLSLGCWPFVDREILSVYVWVTVSVPLVRDSVAQAYGAACGHAARRQSERLDVQVYGATIR